MYSKDYQTYSKPHKKAEENNLNKRKETTPSSHTVETQIRKKNILNFCSNNYLGFPDNQYFPQSIQKIANLQKSSSQDIYKNLEQKISDFLNMEDTLVYAHEYDANGGILESLFTQNDIVFTDELNYFSITKYINTQKSLHYPYKHKDLNNLEAQLKKASSLNYRFKLIITDGIFFMDGMMADLKGICDLAEKYNALVLVNDSEATGFIGKTGRGTSEYYNVMEKVDIITSTFGRPFGRFTSGRKEIIDLLRNRTKPYVFTNSLIPEKAETASRIITMLSEDNFLAEKVIQNAEYFRKEIKNQGFDIIENNSAIIPIMLYDSELTQKFADKLLEDGIYTLGFFHPVVPKGKARIRVQLSAAHTTEHLDKAIASFSKIGKQLAVI